MAKIHLTCGNERFDQELDTSQVYVVHSVDMRQSQLRFNCGGCEKPAISSASLDTELGRRAVQVLIAQDAPLVFVVGSLPVTIDETAGDLLAGLEIFEFPPNAALLNPKAE